MQLTKQMGCILFLIDYVVHFTFQLAKVPTLYEILNYRIPIRYDRRELSEYIGIRTFGHVLTDKVQRRAYNRGQKIVKKVNLHNTNDAEIRICTCSLGTRLLETTESVDFAKRSKTSTTSWCDQVRLACTHSFFVQDCRC